MGETTPITRRFRLTSGLAAAIGLISLTAMTGLDVGHSQVSQAAARPALGIAAGGTLQFDSTAKQEAYLSAARDLGATWLRFDFTWNDIQRSDAASYDWARYDSLVSRASRYGLSVVGMIGYPPPWARAAACSGSQFCRPKDAATFGTFAGRVAARYGPRGVHHWEIWNEQNTTLFFQPAADPAFYTSMLSSAYAAIHRADPGAKVITGGTAPSSSGNGNLAPVDFVSKMYAAGAAGHFDILGHHPYCYAGTFDCPRTHAAWSAWSQMSQTPSSLRSVMARNGDSGKQIWATEFGAPTSGDSTAVSEKQQSAMLSDGLRRFSGYSWAGPLFIYSLRDRGTNPGSKEDWFGVLRADGSRKPSFGALSSLIHAAAPAARKDGRTATGASQGRSGIGKPLATAVAAGGASTSTPPVTPGASASDGSRLVSAGPQQGPQPSAAPGRRTGPVVLVALLGICGFGAFILISTGKLRKIRAFSRS
jgi:polysaccharide biosynthesis protein PslG